MNGTNDLRRKLAACSDHIFRINQFCFALLNFHSDGE